MIFSIEFCDQDPRANIVCKIKQILDKNILESLSIKVGVVCCCLVGRSAIALCIGQISGLGKFVHLELAAF